MPQPAPAASEYRASLPAIWSALIAVYLIWGSTYLAIRYAVETTPPFLMAAVRFIVSGGFLYALRRFSGDPRPAAVEWRSAAIIGVFLLVGGNGGVVWAEQFVTSSLAALLVATVPLWMVLIDAFRPTGHRPGLIAVTGILIGFGGVVLLIGSAASGADTANLLGAAALVVASLAWTIGSLYGKSARLPASPLLGTGMEMLAGGLALMLLAIVPRRMERLRACGCFSTVGTRCRLPDRNRLHRFRRLRLAFARRPHAIGGNLCLRQSAGCGFAGLLPGPGADDTPYFARRHAHHRIGRAGKHSAKTMNRDMFCPVALVALLCQC